MLYEPVAMVVGTRGRDLTSMKGLMSGSVSKYCLQRSPVPTIVVRPSSKRTRKKLKRQQEAGRSVYSNILTKAQTTGGRHIRDKSIPDLDVFQTKPKDAEAEAVDKAVGPRKGILRNKNYGGQLARVTSTGEAADEVDYPSERFALPIGYLTTETAPTAEAALKSPFIQALGEWDDSPRTASPARSDGALTDDTDDDTVGKPTIVEERRPSTRSQTPWLNSILSKPEAPRRPQSVDRSDRGARSRSR